ncbi:efflux RND transporter periplasmic adaptor subunit [Ochrobactrum vermis]|uniref:Efflux RND transporter periplasmic adaptor subunit n=1 Tax=Ochrobactrum vermis TaxID=1827297 RepID=A0ABU8PGU0_9HYPH|nr:efflux RND transporter periplasmic adaptor subunit [Ochrobactrum vermis]PQZ25305.1 efflux transporter periplasmic adaptor subunit [Ochrobactrum vermis]
MKRKHVLTLGSGIAALGVAAFILFEVSGHERTDADPRTAPSLVRLVAAQAAGTQTRSFTGTVEARIQSNLGFRVPGKIVERMVDVGQQVRAGQALMRIDETDLQLALTAKRNAVDAARALLVQAQADERRYAILVRKGLAATPQRYEQAKAALDTAAAQLSAAEAEARVAENEASYSVLTADADGTVVNTLGEPGQVVAAGQTVVQLAHNGPREAVVWLPETLRPQLGSVARANIYGNRESGGNARLRQISDSADAQTRTYEARYVLEGAAASAPLGSTVTVEVSDSSHATGISVPISAVLDNGNRTGVWVVNSATSTVHLVPVTIEEVGQENALVSGVEAGQQIVALGAHLLNEGDAVRTEQQLKVANQ